MFTQILDPTGNLFLTWLVALIPVALLLFLLAGLRLSAWLAALIGSIVTFLLGLWVWQMPLDDVIRAYIYGSATGIWNVDWITFWGVMLFNTLVTIGGFDKMRRWLIQQGTRDVRVQTILFAWAFGALLEGLVGFGYPWAFVAPILIAIGIPDLDAIRVAAIANNAPVSYGALGAPIIALATVTAGTLGLPFQDLLPIYSASVGKIVANLALLPPWILLYLVSGSKGMWSAWPLAIVGSLGYIAGQLPTAVYLGPYLPDVIGSIVCFVILLLLLKVWRPAQVLAYGGHPAIGGTQAEAHGLSGRDIVLAWMPIAVLIAVVVAWTLAQGGQTLFMRYGCSGCHGGNGVGGNQSGSTVRAPALAGLYGSPVTLADGRIVTADDRYIRDCIVAPDTQRVASYPPVMPSFAGQISEEDLLKIIAYIKSLAPENPS